MFVLFVVLCGLFLACLFASMFKGQEEEGSTVQEEGPDVETGRTSALVAIEEIFEMENRKISKKISFDKWYKHHDGNMDGVVNYQGKTLGDLERDSKELELQFDRTYESLGPAKSVYDYYRRVYVDKTLREVTRNLEFNNSVHTSTRLILKHRCAILQRANDDVYERIGAWERMQTIPPIPVFDSTDEDEFFAEQQFFAEQIRILDVQNMNRLRRSLADTDQSDRPTKIARSPENVNWGTGEDFGQFLLSGTDDPDQEYGGNVRATK